MPLVIDKEQDLFFFHSYQIDEDRGFELSLVLFGLVTSEKFSCITL